MVEQAFLDDDKIAFFGHMALNGSKLWLEKIANSKLLFIGIGKQK